jgi:hypothetical protein
LVILHFEMHHMKNQLYYFIEDQKFLLSIMIIAGKIVKRTQNIPFLVFDDNIEEKYNDTEMSISYDISSLAIFGTSLNTTNNVMISLSTLIPTKILPNINYLSYDIMKQFKQHYRDINMPMDTQVDTGLLYLITDNPNIKTKPKHFDKLILNL